MTTNKGKTEKGKEKEQTKTELEQTYGTFKFIGEVVGLRDDSVKDGVTESSNKEWKSIRFGIKTSPDNSNYTELFGMEKDEFIIKNAKTGEIEKVSFDDRFEDIEEGYYMLGTNMTLEREETGKLNKDGTPKTKGVKVTMQELDAVDYIHENLGNGDTVYVSGNIQYSIYENDEGEEIQQKRYSIGFIGKQDYDIDFEADDFEETSMFEQTIVINGTERDADNKEKIYVHASIITYKKEAIPATFTVYEEGATKKLAAKMRSFKFGTQLTVSGQVINSYLQVEAEEEETDDWGGVKPTGYRKGTTGQRVSEMRITYADASTLVEKKYTEADFIDTAKQTFGKTNDDDFGVKPKNSNDDGRPIDISEDDLPF